jgi:gliding motility-associated-like protein
MNHLRTFLLVLFLYLPFYVIGQKVYFVADTVYGCDSLRVKFYFFNTTSPDTVLTVDWNFGNGENSTGKSDQEVIYNSPGLYSVSITINNNTIYSRQNYIRVYPAPDALFNYSDSLELGSYTFVFQSPNQIVDTISYTWFWEFGDEETDIAHSVIHTFPASGIYQTGLTVTNEAGCSASSSQEIEVMDVLKWNNVFTPNYDNRNDNFVVLSNGVTVYSIRIYSRSGIQVYRAESPTIIWDGRNQSGQELPSGIYFFTIKSMDDSGIPEQSGFVHLFREREKL